MAEQWGDRGVVVLGDTRLSYRELEAESRRLGRALQASGVERGSRVALLAPNGPEWVIGWMAAARIGALVVLLNTFYQARELGWALRHCQAEVLLTVDHYLNHDYLARLEQAVPGLADQHREAVASESHPSLRAVWVWNDEPSMPDWAGTVDQPCWVGPATLKTSSSTRRPARIEPEDPMVVIYTSGSTSEPKGVIHSHSTVIVHPFNLLQFRDLRTGGHALHVHAAVLGRGPVLHPG